MIKEEIKYSYDMDYFVKWSYGKVYELYDRLSWRWIDFSDIKSERLTEIVAHAYFYWITTDQKTFYEKIQQTLEHWKSSIIYNPHKK